MKYYTISMEKDYSDAPRIINWQSRIDLENILNYKYDKLEQAYALFVKNEGEFYKTDIIIEPIFAVSPMIKYCLETYEPNMRFTELYLVQSKEQTITEYFIPHLTHEDCLEGTGFNVRSYSNERKTFINLNNVARDKFIFRALEGTKAHIVMRAELVESIIRRGARGIHMEKLECKKIRNGGIPQHL